MSAVVDAAGTIAIGHVMLTKHGSAEIKSTDRESTAREEATSGGRRSKVIRSVNRDWPCKIMPLAEWRKEEKTDDSCNRDTKMER